MNWQQVTTIVTLAMTIIGATWWTSQNVVFAEPYKAYQQQQELRWLMYDERALYNEYRDMRNIKRKSPSDKERIADLEHEMKLKRGEISSLRGSK